MLYLQIYIKPLPYLNVYLHVFFIIFVIWVEMPHESKRMLSEEWGPPWAFVKVCNTINKYITQEMIQIYNHFRYYDIV